MTDATLTDVPATNGSPRHHAPDAASSSSAASVPGSAAGWCSRMSIWTWQRSRVTALIGPSGCGKSTFIRTLNRMHETIPGAQLAGTVELDGANIYDREQRANEVRRHIGMVFQRPNPFPAMSIYDNVLAGMKFTRTKVSHKDDLVEESLARAGLWSEVRNRLRDLGGALSGGQQQRLCIARALAVKPKVLLMDEPCSALDPASTIRIEQTIEEICVRRDGGDRHAQHAAGATGFAYLRLLPRRRGQARTAHRKRTDGAGVQAAEGPADGGLRRWKIWLTWTVARSHGSRRSASRVLSSLFAGMALLVATTVVVLTATAAPAAAGGPAISGVGSSYAALAIIQWDAEVSSEFGDTVNYLTQSSVIGLNDFANYPQVDFGASEIGYSTGQADSSPPASFQYQYLPDIAGATCLDYNLTSTVGSPITTLKLNSQVLAGIFSGTITEWDDPAIQALNPGVLLPHNSIVVVFRSDASGDNFIFSDYLETEQSSLWNTFTSAVSSPNGAAAIWPQPPSGQRSVGPYNFGNWTSENGSDTASDYVYTNQNTITYVETGYALLHHNPCAEVLNAGGAYVAPSESADAIALQNDVLQSDLEQNLTPVFNSPQSGAYPISAYSYLLMAEQSEIPASKQAVEAQYVQFLACAGQEAAGKLGYSPLPPNLVQADFDAIGRITGTQPAAPTASNCPDPYLTGAFNAGGAAGSGPPRSPPLRSPAAARR